MSWQWADEPSHIAPETGPNLLTGSGPWTVALDPGAEYALVVDVLGEGDTLVEWQVSVTDGETGDLDYPTISETVPGGDWVTVTQSLTAPAFDATATITLSTPGQSRDPSLAALTGRVVLTVPGDVLAESIMASGGIVAGTPGGARVELTEEGLAAYDSTGTETALIRGEGGEFVGGEFRTSDDLPGQVMLSDDAVETNFTTVTGPGIRVTPEDTTGFEYMPGIGPSTAGLMIYGGKRTGIGSSIVQANPDASFMRTFREDGTTAGEIQTSSSSSYMRTYREDGATGGSMQTSPAASLMSTYQEDGETVGGVMQTSPTGSLMRTYRGDGTEAAVIQTSSTDSRMRTYSGNSSEAGWIRARPQDAELAYVDPNNTYFSRVRADADEAHLFTRAGGTSRYLRVNATGIWVESGTESYNLEQTAQDSGWIPITHATGYQDASGGAPFEYRLMGGMIHLRGRVSPTSGTLAAGTAYTIGTLPTEIRPTHTHRTVIAGGSSSQWGRIDISAGTGTLSVAPISGGMDWVDLTGVLWTAD